MSKERIEATMTFDADAFKYIENKCNEYNLSQTEFLKKAMALMIIALDNKKLGNKIAIIDKKTDKLEEIKGL
jgi:hypothetical protein